MRSYSVELSDRTAVLLETYAGDNRVSISEAVSRLIGAGVAESAPNPLGYERHTPEETQERPVVAEYYESGVLATSNSDAAPPVVDMAASEEVGEPIADESATATGSAPVSVMVPLDEDGKPKSHVPTPDALANDEATAEDSDDDDTDDVETETTDDSSALASPAPTTASRARGRAAAPPPVPVAPSEPDTSDL